jgi:hypothetical protein
MKNGIKKIGINLGVRIILFAKVLVKEIVVLFPTRGLNSAAIRLKANNLSTNLDAQVATFGIMSPTTASVRLLVTKGQGIAAQRATAEKLVKSLVLQENANAKVITTTIRDNWMTPIKTGAAGDTSLIVGVGAAVKGQGTPPDTKRFANTWPEPIVVNQNIALKLTQELIGSDVLSKGKPYGAVSIGYYSQVGGVAPARNNHPLAVMGTPFSKMKFTDTFIAAQAGLIAYYIFFWVDKDGNKGPESPVFFYTVTA